MPREAFPTFAASRTRTNRGVRPGARNAVWLPFREDPPNWRGLSSVPSVARSRIESAHNPPPHIRESTAPARREPRHRAHRRRLHSRTKSLQGWSAFWWSICRPDSPPARRRTHPAASSTIRGSASSWRLQTGGGAEDGQSEAIRSGGRVEPGFQEGLLYMRFCEAVALSSYTGRIVSIDDLTPSMLAWGQPL